VLCGALGSSWQGCHSPEAVQHVGTHILYAHPECGGTELFAQHPGSITVYLVTFLFLMCTCKVEQVMHQRRAVAWFIKLAARMCCITILSDHLLKCACPGMYLPETAYLVLSIRTRAA